MKKIKSATISVRMKEDVKDFYNQTQANEHNIIIQEGLNNEKSN